jgi:hypothetical protein
MEDLYSSPQGTLSELQVGATVKQSFGWRLTYIILGTKQISLRPRIGMRWTFETRTWGGHTRYYWMFLLRVEIRR